MTKDQRNKVFGKYGGRCAYCGCELQKGWHVDHIEPVVRDWWIPGAMQKPENDTESNYNPSCSSCNIQKSSMPLEVFRQNIAQFIRSLNLYSTQYKFAKRYGLVTETGSDVKFYFETLNNKDDRHSNNS